MKTRRVCLFCGRDMHENMSCPRCKSYKGIVEASDCPACGELIPKGEKCSCKKPKKGAKAP